MGYFGSDRLHFKEAEFEKLDFSTALESTASLYSSAHEFRPSSSARSYIGSIRASAIRVSYRISYRISEFVEFAQFNQLSMLETHFFDTDLSARVGFF